MAGFDVMPWCLTLQIIACTFHSIAIASTIFRFMYCWCMARFWWDDGWAAFALAIDILCLVSVWIEPSAIAYGPAPPIDEIARWIAQLSFTTVDWACRMSILFSIVRVTQPSQQLRRIVFFIGCSFIVMWIALIVQKIRICLRSCMLGPSVGLAQLITNTLADVVLVALPIWFLRQTKITARQRIMLYPVFFATFLITVVTILRSAALFTTMSSGVIITGHVKAAVSLVVCNLLTIVTFINSICHRGKANNLEATDELITFTNVDLNTGFMESTTNSKETSATVDSLEEASTSVTSCSIIHGEDNSFSSCSV